MAPFLYAIIFFFLMVVLSSAQGGPPSPGYYPSSRISSQGFDQSYQNLWGPQHQSVDQGALTIWLDRSSGSGFKSKRSYNSGYFSASIKLHPGYTAGVITSLYLSNNEQHPGEHDEVDIEFLGTTLDKPYVLQTNVYVKGTGDGSNIIGRENRFHLWFDPTEDFHNYAIVYNPTEIIFLVDDVPIRMYARKSDATFPLRPMWVYGSIWDASTWATEDGKYKANYEYEPFIGRYNKFKIGSGSAASPSGTNGLSQNQYAAMDWVQKNYKIYDYCTDPKRDHSLTPEC